PVLARQNYARTGDIGGHQIDGELNSIETEIERQPQRLYQRRLAGAGYAFDQHVTAREQGREQLLDGLLMPDDHLVDLGLDTPKRPGEIRHRWRFRLHVAHLSNTRLMWFDLRPARRRARPARPAPGSG